MQLFKTLCATDWKGRPEHTLTLVASAEGEHAPTARGLLLEFMGRDVEEWQERDRVADRQNAEADAATDELPAYSEDGWGIYQERWEMNLERDFAVSKETKPYVGESLRQFVWTHNGEFQTLVYHIMALDRF